MGYERKNESLQTVLRRTTFNGAPEPLLRQTPIKSLKVRLFFFSEIWDNSAKTAANFRQN